MAEIIDDMRTFTITLTAPAGTTPTETPDSTAPAGSYQWIADKYDRNLSRKIEDDEMGPAYEDYRSGKIRLADYSKVVNAFTNQILLPLPTGVVGASSTTTCNTPTVTFPNTPDIAISRGIASCKVSINTGDGSKLDPRTSTVELWDGETWVPNAISKFDLNAPVQTRTITWPLKKTSDVIHAKIYIKNACGKETDWVQSEAASYVLAGGALAKGTIVSVDAPSSVLLGSTISVRCTIKNIGGSTGRFRIDLYRLDDDGDHVSHGAMGSATLEAGRSYTPTATRFQVPFSGTSAKYEIRCVRLT